MSSTIHIYFYTVSNIANGIENILYTYFCNCAIRVKHDSMNGVVHGIQWNPNHRREGDQQSHCLSPLWIFIFSRLSVLNWLIGDNIVDKHALKSKEGILKQIIHEKKIYNRLM